MALKDKIRSLINEAPTAQAGVNVNFGPLTVTPIVKTFHGAGQKPTVLTLEEFAEKNKVSVDDVELGSNDAFNLRFTIDVSDLNEALDFAYQREIPVVESSAKIKTDWTEIVRPSLEAVFGPSWYDILIGTTKKPAGEVYVAAENVDSLRLPKEGGKNYGVPKLIAKYKNRDECVRARDTRYPKRDAEETVEDTEVEETEGSDFPEEVLEQTRALYAANRSNDEKTLKMLNKKPFGDYDAAALLAAAKEDEE